MLKQLGLDHQILQQLVDWEAQLSEAKRLKMSVSDDELAQYIMAMPAFQEGGRFVGEARFAAALRMNRPPMTVEQFQESLRGEQVIGKLCAAVTDWITVTDQEVAQEFQRRNEKVKLEMVSVPADKFRSAVTVTDADLATYFEAHKEQYRIRRAAQDPVPARGCGRLARLVAAHAARGGAQLQRERRALLDGRAGSRERDSSRRPTPTPTR